MRRLKVIAAICGVGLGFAASAPAAHAGSFNFIPQEETEIETDLGCLDPTQCKSIDGVTINSLDIDPNDDFGQSRLFVDKKGTDNSYTDGSISISFDDEDTGTNEDGGYWLRAAAIKNDGTTPQNGQLETGLFEFVFDDTVDKITLDFFDIEGSAGETGIVSLNGTAYDSVLTPGDDNAVTLENVNSFTIRLGDYTSFDGNGDGVTLSGFKTSRQFAKAVPEPTTTFSLGALAVAGMFGVKKRKKLKK
ncbi:MAG: LEVG family PEP-CTERM protein [Cyanobacteria bacterium P01_D01_bin.50]